MLRGNFQVALGLLFGIGRGLGEGSRCISVSERHDLGSNGDEQVYNNV